MQNYFIHQKPHCQDLLKKIGYRGYQEFIYQYENTFEEKRRENYWKYKIVLNAYQEVLNKTYNLVDEAQIGRIVGYLNKADRVLVCGCGSSGLSAKRWKFVLCELV